MESAWSTTSTRTTAPRSRNGNYLPGPLRELTARLLSRAEEASSRHFHLVLAERYYAERFPRGQTVLNHARFPALDEDRLLARPRAGHPRLIYTGNVKPYRGAHRHSELLQHLPDAEVFLVGRCEPELAAELRAGSDPERLHLEGVGGYVPHERIVSYYLRESWTAGLALFPPRRHTLRKELTKVFEYMAYGIPVLCTGFPNLRRIVEGAECGICVDPENGAAAAGSGALSVGASRGGAADGRERTGGGADDLQLGHPGAKVAAFLRYHPQTPIPNNAEYMGPPVMTRFGCKEPDMGSGFTI